MDRAGGRAEPGRKVRNASVEPACLLPALVR